jgi:hypothetical protein
MVSFSVVSYVIGHILMSFIRIENCIFNKCRKTYNKIKDEKEVDLYRNDKDAYMFFIDRYNNLY